jgi:hypothetical protein
MTHIILRKLIEAEIKRTLSESAVEPSEQIIKLVQKEIKAKTGIVCTLSLDKTNRTSLFYTFDLSNQIKTPVMNALFDTMSLDVTCQQIPNSIGGYSFEVSINYTHPSRGSNGLELGTVFVENGKVSSRFRGKIRTSETPY